MCATQMEWDLFALAGLGRNMFWTVEEDEVIRAPGGTKVANGAMGVDKFEETPDWVEEILRFLSTLTPINHFMQLLDGDSKRLPHLGPPCSSSWARVKICSWAPRT